MRGDRRGIRAFLSLVGLALAGCGGGDVADALARAEPYAERFDRFDAWARRTLAADPAIRGSALLEETLFAPLLLEPDVADAWVVRGPGPAGSWSLRGGDLPGEDAAWIRARHPAHGELGILLAPHPGGAEPRARPCLFVARDAPGPGPGASRVEVVVAFVIGKGGAT